MEHKSLSSVYRIPRVVAVVLLLALLSVIALLCGHVKSQEAVILRLHAKIITLESREESDRMKLRSLSLEELFRRIDHETVP